MRKIFRYLGMSTVGTLFLLAIIALAVYNVLHYDYLNGAILFFVSMRLFVIIMWDGQYVDEIHNLQEGIERLRGLNAGLTRENRLQKVKIDHIEKHLRSWPSLHEELFPVIKERKEIL